MPWEYWFDTILAGRIKASKPSEFNDPFDCVGAIEGQLSEDAAREFADKSNPLQTDCRGLALTGPVAI